MGVTNVIVALVFACFVYLGSAKYPEDDKFVQILFTKWKKEHNKSYRSEEEHQYRLKAFKDNLINVKALNVKYRGETEFELNKFADMSPREFKDKILMPKRPGPKFPRERYTNPTLAPSLPDTFDWTTKGLVTSVKDQGSAGSCWAFSTIGNIEGQWVKLGNKLTDLSVEQVVDCDGGEDIKGGNADCGVFGGWPYLAYQYIARAGGLETWQDYGYCCGLGGEPGTCEVCPAPGYNKTLCGPSVPYCNMSQSCSQKLDTSKFVKGLKVDDWKAIDKNETLIAQQLIDIGPLSVALDAAELQFYHRGVFKPHFCSKTNLDHAVLMVGYGTYKGWFETYPVWKIKNSWGKKWGEDGYFQILRGYGTCGINTQVTTAVLQK